MLDHRARRENKAKGATTCLLSCGRVRALQSNTYILTPVARIAHSPVGLPGLRAPGAGLRAQCAPRRTTILSPKV